MSDNEIETIAKKYRSAIETARDRHLFNGDKEFIHFPTQCCGLTCSLLAKHLFDHHGIETLWISTNRDADTHAWLVLKDNRISGPHFFIPVLDSISTIIKSYSGTGANELTPIYYKEDIENGLIIDITADQFNDFKEKVFVGCDSTFHKSFDFRGAYENDGINDERLLNLYYIIESMMKDDITD